MQNEDTRSYYVIVLNTKWSIPEGVVDVEDVVGISVIVVVDDVIVDAVVGVVVDVVVVDIVAAATVAVEGVNVILFADATRKYIKCIYTY